MSIKATKISRSKKRQTDVYAAIVFILKKNQRKNIEIYYKLLTKENYFFQSLKKTDFVLNICYDDSNVLITANCIVISMTNLEIFSIKIRKNELINHVTTHKDFKFVENVNFNYENVFLDKHVKSEEIDNFFVITVLKSDITLKSNINDHWKIDFRIKITKIFQIYKKLFRSDFDRFNDDIKMLISFKNEKNIDGLKQAFFSMFAKNKKAMNEIFDFFVKNERVQKLFLKIIFSAFSPVFVIWKNNKSKIMMNLRKINTRLYFDVYSLSKQNIILFSLSGSEIFSSINFIKEFLQQNIDSKNYWKTTFATFHKKLKWLTIFNMNLKNISNFFQNRMKKIFDFYLWKFVLIYMNDIIIYFKISTDHFAHLNEAFNLLKKSKMTLSFSKCHFAYLNIKTLKHHVNRFDLNTLKEKTDIICRLMFFKILRKFEIELSFFDYYKKFVTWYVVKERFLVIFKTLNFKNSFNKKKSRLRWANGTRLKINELIESSKTNDKTFIKKKKSIRIFASIKKCLKIWKNLKKTLIDFSIFAFSNFSKSFILYIDENKKWSFEMTIHQLNKNGIEKFILFFSKCLLNAKTKYWSTELKTAVFVWTLTKFFQYFDDDFFTVVTNHFALKTVFQTNITDRKLARLNEWIMFLSIFLSKMTIVHRSKRFHLNADELFRFRFENETISLSIAIIADEKNLLTKITIDFLKNKSFVKIMTKLKKLKKQTKKQKKIDFTLLIISLKRQFEIFLF